MQHEVLIVEDDDAIRRLVTILLRRQGFSIDFVNNGRDAIEHIGKKRYNAILLDLMLPLMNGFEVLAQMEPDLFRCVIVLTAAAEPDVKKLHGKPVFRVLRKPFDVGELISTIRECIASS